MSSVFLRSLLAGGASGLAVDLALFPLDSLKTRWQAGCALHFSRPYSGLLSTTLASFPCAATFWATYNCVKRASRSYEWSPAMVHIISASCGGIATSIVRNPFEVVKQQLQLQMHASTVPAVRAILKQRGVQGLFAGLASLIGREVPFDVLQFLIYEYLKSEDYGGQEKSISARLWCGAVAGGCAALLTNPIDVVKTRLMTQSRSIYPSTVGAFRVIYRREGLRAFWTGWQLRLLYTTMGGMLFFGTFEAINTVLLPYI